MWKRPKITWLSLMFLVMANGYAQNEIRSLPLKEILQSIEQLHQVQFNFLEEEVSTVLLQPPVSGLSLTEKLAYLKTNTDFDFEFINSQSIVISPKSSAVAMSIDLSDIEIERYLTTGMSKNKDGTFTVKPKKFGILPGLIEPDVLQAMQQIPGINSVDHTISHINVRSGTHDQNLFLWNGIRMYQTGHFFGLISAFNPSMVQQIDITKNGTSAFFGESISSVVALSSQTDSISNFLTSINTNWISADFYFRIKLSGHSSIQLSGRRSYTDWAATPTYNEYSKRIFQNTTVTNVANSQNVVYQSDEDFYFYDFAAQFQQKIGKSAELLVDVIGIRNALETNQSTASYNDFTARKSQLEQQNFGGNVLFKNSWNKKHATHIATYISRYNLDAYNESIENDQVLTQQNVVSDGGFRIENKHLLKPGFVLRNGYQFNEIGITNRATINNPAFRQSEKQTLRSHALVLETAWSDQNDKIALKTGLRTNYWEKFERLSWEPRLQFNYKISDAFSAEILGELKSQATSQVVDQQQDFLGIEKRRWVLSNDSIIPIQKSKQMSVGLTFKNKQWLMVWDNFYKEVDGISSRSQLFQNQLEFANLTGSYETMGSEILVQRNFRQWYTWFSYCWNNSNYTFNENIPAQFASNFQVMHSISWAALYEWKKIKMALGSKWHSGRPETTPATEELNTENPANPIIRYNFPNNATIGDYCEINLSASYEWQLDTKTRLQFGISVINLLDRKNNINRFYRVNASSEIESVNTYGLGRTPNLSLKFQFQ